MTPGLLEELVNAESIWRSITLSQQPLFADMPVEHVDPDPTNKRHWMFATDNRKIMAHIYKPEEVQRRFEEVIVPLFHDAYGFSLDPKDTKECATQLIQDTCTYLLFHELFHPVYCPKSKSDKEKFDVGLKNGIKKGDKGISDRDLVNKVGNVRNAMWDLLIDTFFTYYSRSGSGYDRGLRKEMSQRGYALNNHLLESLPDGIVTTWDITELVDHDPDTLFYPITRAIYGFLHCDSYDLRSNVVNYFKKKMQKKISEANLATAIIGALSGTVKYLDDAELSSVGVVRKTFLDAVDEMYQGRDKAKSDDARRYVVGAITNINTKAELRYRSIEGIIEPLAKYIDVNKEERRDGANTGNGDGQGNEQTSLSQTGGGAEDVLQSLINQNDSDVNGMLGSIANDMSAPQSNRNKRLSNLAKDEYYKRNARPLPVKSPTIEAETREIGKLRTPVKVSERILTPDQLHELPMEAIMQFQQETGIICLSQRSQYQWVYEIYEWEEQPIIDFEYKQTGIILPENIIIRVDGSGSMGGTVFVGKNNSYDCLMHVVYGIMKSVAEAAKSVSKEVQVVGVNYSKHGKTRVSDAVELQTFYDTPNNSAKEVLLNPEGGSTYHDLSAYQEAHRKCKPGKTVEIIITDGDLNSDHDQTMTEIKKIIDSGNTVMLYLPIFQEGAFAQRMKQLARLNANVTYRAFLNFGQIQATVDGILIQYSQRT